VTIAVHFADGIKTVLERFAVGSEAYHRQNYRCIILGRRRAANLEHLWRPSSVDGVSRGMSGVAGHDHEVIASNRKSRSSVVRVTKKKGRKVTWLEPINNTDGETAKPGSLTG
jgi:hypothetical protein